MCDPCCFSSCCGSCVPPGYPYPFCNPTCCRVIREATRNPNRLPKIPKKNYVCALPVGKAWLRKNCQRCKYGCPCKAHCYITPPGVRAQTQYCRQSVCCPPCFST